MTRLLAITGRSPYSATEEAFVQDELETMLHRGVDLVVVPARLVTGEPNAAAMASGLVDHVVAEPVLSGRVAAGAVATLLRHPAASLSATMKILRGSGSLRNLATNVSSLPKALWAAGLARKVGATHVHAYWFAHQATIAMVVGRIAGIPWSATGFRWDIDADNALDAKIRSAAFLRVADEFGQRVLERGSPSPTARPTGPPHPHRGRDARPGGRQQRATGSDRPLLSGRLRGEEGSPLPLRQSRPLDSGGASVRVAPLRRRTATT